MKSDVFEFIKMKKNSNNWKFRTFRVVDDSGTKGWITVLTEVVEKSEQYTVVLCSFAFVNCKKDRPSRKIGQYIAAKRFLANCYRKLQITNKSSIIPHLKNAIIEEASLKNKGKGIFWLKGINEQHLV